MAVGIDKIAPAVPVTEGPRALLLCPWCWEHFHPTWQEWTYCSQRCRNQRAAAYARLDEIANEGLPKHGRHRTPEGYDCQEPRQ
jgi:hypothetical protein